MRLLGFMAFAAFLHFMVPEAYRPWVVGIAVGGYFVAQILDKLDAQRQSLDSLRADIASLRET